MVCFRVPNSHNLWNANTKLVEEIFSQFWSVRKPKLNTKYSTVILERSVSQMNHRERDWKSIVIWCPSPEDTVLRTCLRCGRLCSAKTMGAVLLYVHQHRTHCPGPGPACKAGSRWSGQGVSLGRSPLDFFIIQSFCYFWKSWHFLIRPAKSQWQKNHKNPMISIS